MAKRRKKPRGPFEARPMSGRGGPAGGVAGGLGSLGEHMGDPERYRSEPGTREYVKEFEKGQAGPQRAGTHPPTPSRGAALLPLDPEREYDMPFVRAVPLPAKRVEIVNKVVPITAMRLDIGIKDRTDVLIGNHGVNVVWVGNAAMAAVGVGWPLAAATNAAAYDGGTLSISCTELVPWYGISVGGNSLIVVIESAR